MDYARSITTNEKKEINESHAMRDKKKKQFC